MSETNLSGYKQSFRYRKCSDIDINVHSVIRHWKKMILILAGFEPVHSPPPLPCFFSINRMSDSGYRKKLYSGIRHNVGFRSLSPISAGPISLVTNIGLSGHLCVPYILTRHVLHISLDAAYQNTNFKTIRGSFPNLLYPTIPFSAQTQSVATDLLSACR